jgi:hypothetical protein
MLFLEPNCAGLPATLIEDSVLKPVDKLIWLVMMIAASRGGGQTFLPTLAELARIANVGARNTVSQSLSILRCRRWLTVCHRSWRKGDSQRGSAYALHTRPLTVADTIHLDPEYLAFLERSTGHSHTRVRRVAREVLVQELHMDGGSSSKSAEVGMLKN